MPKSPENIKLSILILSIPSRIKQLETLLEKLENQFDDDRVEILVMLDNKSFHIYEKRNELLDMARGEYLCFLDDDDNVAEHLAAHRPHHPSRAQRGGRLVGGGARLVRLLV